MKRTQRIYKYECPDCGWLAYRAELVDGMMCSKCGCLDKPIVSTEDRTYEINDEVYKDINRAREYARRLLKGEDPSRIDKDLSAEGQSIKETAIMQVAGTAGFRIFVDDSGAQKIY